MTTRTLLATAVASAGLFVVPTAFAQEVSVPNSFSEGDPAVASEVNDNFAALANEIESLGQQTTGAAFSDYFFSPSSNGSLGSRNMIVWEDPNPRFSNADDVFPDTCYITRAWFDASDVDVQLENGPDNPDTINVWQQLCTDTNGSIIWELEYVYTVPEDGFDGDMGVAINLDNDGDQTFEFEEETAYRFKTNIDSLGQTEVRNTTELYLDGNGEVLFANNWVRHVTELNETITVNGIEFNDVAVSNFAGFERTRFLANGIGPILEVNGFQGDPVFSSGQGQRGVIAYRVDGSEDGISNLGGTPVVSGASINKWVEQ